jgi:hypothetical protein
MVTSIGKFHAMNIKLHYMAFLFSIQYKYTMLQCYVSSKLLSVCDPYTKKNPSNLKFLARHYNEFQRFKHSEDSCSYN